MLDKQTILEMIDDLLCDAEAGDADKDEIIKELNNILKLAGYR